MVHALVVHTLLPGRCRILHSWCFGPGLTADATVSGTGARPRAWPSCASSTSSSSTPSSRPTNTSTCNTASTTSTSTSSTSTTEVLLSAELESDITTSGEHLSTHATSSDCTTQADGSPKPKAKAKHASSQASMEPYCCSTHTSVLVTNTSISSSIVTDTEPASSLAYVAQHRNEQLLAVAQEVQSQYTFRSMVASRSYEEDLQRLHGDGVLPDLEIGCFNVRSGNLFSRAYVALWMGILNCGFVLLCEKDENRILAESILKVLIRLLHEHCHVFTRPADLLSKTERADLIVRHILPGGKLLLMSHRLLQQLEKGLEAKLKSLHSDWV